MSGTFSALRDSAPWWDPDRAPTTCWPAPTEPDPAGTPPVVAVTGAAAWSDLGAVWAALTCAWRAFGRPITVRVDGAGAVASAARGWVAEHAFAGARLADHDPPAGPDLTLTFPSPDPRPETTR